MNYEVQYLTITGRYGLPSRTYKEAKADVARLRQLNKQPGHSATGIKIVKLEGNK
jgi:hypothetical protein